MNFVRTLWIVVTLAATCLAGTAQARPLVYQFSGTGSGEMLDLDGSSTRTFADAAFTFSLTGDTDLIRVIPDDTVALDPLAESRILIDGIGAAVITIPTRLGQTASDLFPPPVIFFSRSQSLDLFDFAIPRAVDLSQPFGPITSTSVFALQQFVQVPTTLGLLTFSSSSNVVFEAFAAPVPEPSTAALLLVGLAAAAVVGRRRRPIIGSSAPL